MSNVFNYIIMNLNITNSCISIWIIHKSQLNRGSKISNSIVININISDTLSGFKSCGEYWVPYKWALNGINKFIIMYFYCKIIIWFFSFYPTISMVPELLNTLLYTSISPYNFTIHQRNSTSTILKRWIKYIAMAKKSFSIPCSH